MCKLRLIFGTVVVLLLSMSAWAQMPSVMQGAGYGTMAATPPPVVDEDEQAAPTAQDTVKRKPPKPLESYFFNDSVRAQDHFLWHVDMWRNRIEMTALDTMETGWQIDYPFLKNDVGSAYLGNLGGAAIPLNYFTRPRYEDFQFAQAYDSYYWTPERVRFYNGKAPYTRLTYIMSGQARRYEENFGLIHSQNINPSTGFSLDYLSRGTKGMYTWQKARDKNLSVSAYHTGKKYTVHGGYIYNAVLNNENGGNTDDFWVQDTILEQPTLVPVWLHDAKTAMRNNTYYLVQSYGVPLKKLTEEDFSISDRSSLFIGLASQYDRWVKKYSDTYAQSNATLMDGTNRNFYENWYYNPVMTADSIFESKFANRAFIQLQPWDRNAIIGVIDAGAGVDIHQYYTFSPEQYVSGREKWSRTDYYVYGSVEGKLKKYLDWDADLKYHPTGYRSQDLDIGGHLALSAFVRGHRATLSGALRHRIVTPGFWEQNLFSNHFVWSHSLSKENETRIDLALSVPNWGLELGAHQSVVTGKVYFNADAVIQQESGEVSVSGLYARKDFTFGGFHLNNRVLLQWSTSQAVIPVPLASAYMSYFLEFNVVRNVLRVQAGIDGRFNTSYYAPGFMPSLSQFYNQREKELGDYLCLDAFVSAKWKRMRILVKMARINETLIGESNYQVLHYPLNRMQFKIGFSWNFYD